MEEFFCSTTYDNIRKITTDQGDDYTNGCLLDNPYFEKHFKLIAIDLSKQQNLDVDPRAIQQINFTGNLNRYGNTKMTVCYYHVTNAFPSESTLYSCLNVKELFIGNSREFSRLGGSNGIRTITT